MDSEVRFSPFAVFSLFEHWVSPHHPGRPPPRACFPPAVYCGSDYKATGFVFAESTLGSARCRSGLPELAVSPCWTECPGLPVHVQPANQTVPYGALLASTVLRSKLLRPARVRTHARHEKYIYILRIVTFEMFILVYTSSTSDERAKVNGSNNTTPHPPPPPPTLRFP